MSAVDLRAAASEIEAVERERFRFGDPDGHRLRVVVDRLRAGADAPATVHAIIMGVGFRSGTHAIRVDDADLRRYLRRATYPRERGQVGPSRHYIETRVERAMVRGSWHKWSPDFETLDAIGVLVPADGAA